MKYKFKYFQFYYFERHQLEDYLNMMASQGYYLHKIHHKGLFFCQEEQQPLYYHIDVSQHENEQDKQEYLNYFETMGYHYLDDCQPFYIFTSPQKNSIHTDPLVEQSIIRKIEHKEYIWQFFLIIPVIYLIYQYLQYLDMFSISQGRLESVMNWVLFSLNVLITYIYPFLRYKISKGAHYSYHSVLRRSLWISIIMSIICMNIIFFWLKQSLMILAIGVLILFVIGILGSLTTRFITSHWIMSKLVFIITLGLCCYGGIMYSQGIDDQPTIQYPFAGENEEVHFQLQSQFSSYTEYSIEDRFLNDLIYIESYYIPEWYVINDLTDGYDYQLESREGYDIYMNENQVLIHKDYRYLQIDKQSYLQEENILQYLHW